MKSFSALLILFLFSIQSQGQWLLQLPLYSDSIITYQGQVIFNKRLIEEKDDSGQATKIKLIGNPFPEDILEIEYFSRGKIKKIIGRHCYTEPDTCIVNTVDEYTESGFQKLSYWINYNVDIQLGKRIFSIREGAVDSTFFDSDNLPATTKTFTIENNGNKKQEFEIVYFYNDGLQDSSITYKIEDNNYRLVSKQFYDYNNAKKITKYLRLFARGDTMICRNFYYDNLNREVLITDFRFNDSTITSYSEDGLRATKTSKRFNQEGNLEFASILDTFFISKGVIDSINYYLKHHDGWTLENTHKYCYRAEIQCISPSFFSDTKIYPNPSSGLISILNNSFLMTKPTVHIYDNMGRQISEIRFTKNLEEYDISNFADGIYYLKVENQPAIKFVKH